MQMAILIAYNEEEIKDEVTHCLSQLAYCYEETPQLRQLLSNKVFNWELDYHFLEA